MAKETEFISERPTVSGVRHTKKRGPVVPVSAYGKTRGYLQDGRWLPSWLVWLRRRKFGLVLALLAVAVLVVAFVRLLLGGAK